MNAIVFEHVNITELPEAWRSKLADAPGTTVTVRIEAETEDSTQTASTSTEDLLFDMWGDEDDMVDVPNYIRSIRTSRFNNDGAPRLGS